MLLLEAQMAGAQFGCVQARRWAQISSAVGGAMSVSSPARSLSFLSHGVCLLVARTAWDRLGGFSPAFFMYGEDDDLCLRAARLGYTCTILCDVAIVHHGSGTEPDQARKLCQIFASRSLIIRSWLSAPERTIRWAKRQM